MKLHVGTYNAHDRAVHVTGGGPEGRSPDFVHIQINARPGLAEYLGRILAEAAEAITPRRE